MGEAINQGKLEIFREIFAPDVIDHDPAPDQGKGPEGFIQFFTGFGRRFRILQLRRNTLSPMTTILRWLTLRQARIRVTF